MFQEFDFEIIVKPSEHNVGPDHLSILESGESKESIDDQLSDVRLFWVDVVPNQFIEITTFFMIGKELKYYSISHRRQLVTLMCQLSIDS